MVFHCSQNKDQKVQLALKTLQGLAITLLFSFTTPPFSPFSLCSSHSDLSSVPPTPHTHSANKTSAAADYPEQSLLPPSSTQVTSTHGLDLKLNVTCLVEASLDTLT